MPSLLPGHYAAVKVRKELYVTARALFFQMRRSGLRLNDAYLNLAGHAPDAAAQHYLAERKTNAQALMDMVSFRESTIEQIVRIVITTQSRHFSTGCPVRSR